VLQQPKHGRLDADTGLYYPEAGFFGKDSVTYLVEIGDHRVKVTFFIQTNQGVGTESYKKLCPNPYYWKISSTLDTNGNSTLTSVEYQSPATDTATLAAILGSSVNSLFGTSGVTLSLADLTGGALGQAAGSTITLDTTAAGNGWFIDTTPSDNSEYLPTSNPNEWIAKAGSAAAGKMDMLSVLLHEYGHALGIDHSADGHDYMGTTLTAGVRRLPTADEMALMQQLIAQAKSGLIAQQSATNTDLPSNVPVPFPSLPLGGMGIAFAGLLQRNRYGGLNAVLNNSTMTQYDVAANRTNRRAQ
jgi:hypothetical protein